MSSCMPSSLRPVACRYAGETGLECLLPHRQGLVARSFRVVDFNVGIGLAHNRKRPGNASRRLID